MRQESVPVFPIARSHIVVRPRPGRHRHRDRRSPRVALAVVDRKGVEPGKRSLGSLKPAKELKPSDPAAVDRYMRGLKHPLKDVVGTLRKIILKADPAVGEEIKWNAPSFFFTGEMEPSDPKLYRRYLVIFNLFRKDCIRLVFWGGAKANDPTGILQGTYADGRRLALFRDVDAVKSNAKALGNIIRDQLKALAKQESLT